jgi:hypothetical protein
MSVNLSPLPYAGGVFQMRERESVCSIVEFANIGWDDAILFRVSGRL